MQVGDKVQIRFDGEIVNGTVTLVTANWFVLKRDDANEYIQAVPAWIVK